MRVTIGMLSLFFSLLTGAYAEQKVVLISGASGGIGMAVVRAFEQEGWKVWAGYCNSFPQQLEELSDVRLIPLDVRDDQMIKKAIQTMIAEDGKIDALINNAGYGLIGSEESISVEDAQQLFDVNFFGVLRLVQAVVPHMRAENAGHIINISSTSGIRAVAGLGLYAASKFALEGLSESLAVTLSPWNIQVSLVEPGTVKNDWVKHCPLGMRESGEKIYENLSQALVDKLVQLSEKGQECEEIASLIVNIANTAQPDMRYQTSQHVRDVAAKKLVDISGNAMRDQQLLFFRSLVGEQ